MNFCIYPLGIDYTMIPIFAYSSGIVENYVPQINIEHQSAQNSLQTKYQIIQLDITAQDLIKAGYGYKRNVWSQDQDRILLKLIKTENMDWVKISKKMTGRNPKMCYSRYRRLSYFPKKRWQMSEQRKMVELLKQNDMNWEKMANHIPGRTARQLEQHYQFCLRPNIKKAQWTLQEDLLLINLLKKYGAQWKKITTQIEGRSEYQIKNRYFGRLLKIIKKKTAQNGHNKSQTLKKS